MDGPIRSFEAPPEPRRPFDLDRGDDITTMPGAGLAVKFDARGGFCSAVLHCLRLVPDGLATFGPPCGSFTFMNSGTSGRSSNKPYGHEHKQYVETASMRLGCGCFFWFLWAFWFLSIDFPVRVC